MEDHVGWFLVALRTLKRLLQLQQKGILPGDWLPEVPLEVRSNSIEEDLVVMCRPVPSRAHEQHLSKLRQRISLPEE